MDLLLTPHLNLREEIDKTITTNNGAYKITMADFAFSDVNDTPQIL